MNENFEFDLMGRSSEPYSRISLFRADEVVTAISTPLTLPSHLHPPTVLFPSPSFDTALKPKQWSYIFDATIRSTVASVGLCSAERLLSQPARK